MPYLLFLKKRQNLQLSSAASCRWPFKGQNNLINLKAVYRIENGQFLISQENRVKHRKFSKYSLSRNKFGTH